MFKFNNINQKIVVNTPDLEGTKVIFYQHQLVNEEAPDDVKLL